MTIAPEKKAYATIVLHAIGRLTRLPNISNNVGSVKLFLSTLPLVTEKSFSLSFFSVFFLLCIDGQGSLVILRSASVRPKHLFDPYFDHDYFFKLPLQGAGCPIKWTVLLHTMSGSELSRVRTELYGLRILPAIAPHPVQANGYFARHRHLGDSTFSPHRQV